MEWTEHRSKRGTLLWFQTEDNGVVVYVDHSADSFSVEFNYVTERTSICVRVAGVDDFLKAQQLIEAVLNAVHGTRAVLESNVQEQRRAGHETSECSQREGIQGPGE